MKRQILMMVIALVLVCTVAYAGDSEIGKTIDWAWATLMKALAVVIVGLIMNAVKKLAEKYGVELTEKREAMIEGAALKAIGYAEEWAHKKVDLDKVKVRADEKFSKAVRKLTDKVPFLTEEMARTAIVSNLPKFRAMAGAKIDTLVAKLKEKK